MPKGAAAKAQKRVREREQKNSPPERERRSERSSDDDNTSTARWKYVVLLAIIVGGGFQALLPAFDNLHLFAPGTVKLSVDKPEVLQQVFFGGDAWLIGCTDESGKLPRAWDETNFLIKNKEFHMGALDCSARLPSGKSTLERFGISPSQNESHFTSLLFANGWKQPKIVPPAFYLWSDVERAGEQLFQHIVKESQVHLDSVGSQSQLISSCLRHKQSLLIMAYGSSFTDDKSKEAAKKLMDKFRLIRFCVVNVQRYTTSLDAKLPQTSDGTVWPRIVYFRKLNQTKKEDVWAARAHRETFSYNELEAFVTGVSEQSQSVTPTAKGDFAILHDAPVIRVRGGSDSQRGSKPKPSKPSKPAQKSEKPKSHESDVKEEKDEQQQEQKQKPSKEPRQSEREKARREQMDREAEAQTVKKRKKQNRVQEEEPEFVDLDSEVDLEYEHDEDEHDEHDEHDEDDEHEDERDEQDED